MRATSRRGGVRVVLTVTALCLLAASCSTKKDNGTQASAASSAASPASASAAPSTSSSQTASASSSAMTSESASPGSSSAAPPAAPKFAEPTEKVSLTYVGAAYAADDLKPVFEAFEKAHPNIKIKYESTPFDQLNSVLQTRLGQAGDIDVFDSDMPRTDAYVARGWLSDLTPSFGDVSSQVDKASIDASTVDGKLVAMPLQTSSQLLYYNKKLLEKAGVALPSVDPTKRMTWQQVVADGKKAQDKGAKWGLVYDQVDRYYQQQPLPESIGGGPGATGDGNLKPDVNNDKWVKAFDFFGSTFAQGIAPRGVPAAETSAEFAGGRTAFFAGGPWWAPGFIDAKDLDFGVSAYPYMEGGEPVTPTGAWSLGLNKNSKNQDAALIFLNFMGLENGGFTQYVKAIAIPPANTEGAKKYYEQATFTAPEMAGAKELLAHEISTTARVRLKTVGYIEFEDVMTKTFDDIINGTSAKDALGKAQTDLEKAWAKYKK